MEKSLETMSKDERSLLLFFETLEVDHKGIIDNPMKMNVADFNMAEQWKEDGFIEFERHTLRDALSGDVVRLTYRVILSDEAWKLAHAERRARSERMKKAFKFN